MSNKPDNPCVEIVVLPLTLDDDGDLAIELVKGKDRYGEINWMFPSGSVNIRKESFFITASKILQSNIGLKLSHKRVEQVVTKADPDTNLLTIVYMAFIPKNTLKGAKPGDAPGNKELFKILIRDDGVKLWSAAIGLFDFESLYDGEIFDTTLYRIQNRIEYTEDAFAFLENNEEFTIRELEEVYEKITGRTYNASNFTRDFYKKWVDTGVVKALGTTRKDLSRRPAALYKFLG